MSTKKKTGRVGPRRDPVVDGTYVQRRVDAHISVYLEADNGDAWR